MFLISQNVTVQNISKNPLNTKIHNHLVQTFQQFSNRTSGVEGEKLGTSTLPASEILENCSFSAFGEVECSSLE